MMRRIDARQPVERRCGLTIYEVVLSMAIFVMAMVAISQLITTGSRASTEAQLHSQAAIRAESKMAEIVSGSQPLSAVAGEADPSDSRWVWSMDAVDSANASGVKELTVTVTHLSEAGEADVSYTLKRLMRDPQLYIDAALAEDEAAAAAQAKANSANSKSSGSTGTTGTAGKAGTSTKSSGSSSNSSSKTSGGSMSSGKTSGGSSGAASKSSGGSSGAASKSSGGSSGQSTSKAKTP
jgi:general secretion pathway protein I